VCCDTSYKDGQTKWGTISNSSSWNKRSCWQKVAISSREEEQPSLHENMCLQSYILGMQSSQEWSPLFMVWCGGQVQIKTLRRWWRAASRIVVTTTGPNAAMELVNMTWSHIHVGYAAILIGAHCMPQHSPLSVNWRNGLLSLDHWKQLGFIQSTSNAAMLVLHVIKHSSDHVLFLCAVSLFFIE